MERECDRLWGSFTMNRFHVAAFAAILMFTPRAFAQTKARASAEEEQLKKLDHQWLDAEKRLDIAYCEKFFADSYVLVFPNGQPYTKKQWLDILRGADHPTITFLDPEDIKVHLHGNVAILTDHTTLKGHDSKGVSMDGEFNVFRVLIKKNGNWRAAGVVMNAIAAKK
jgi:ketosteroid isomerase-like protein